MFITYDEDNGVAQGPFDSEAKAMRWLKGVVLACGEQQARDALDGLGYQYSSAVWAEKTPDERLENYITGQFKIMEVEFVEQDDEEFDGYDDGVNGPYVIVQDDGSILREEATREEALYQAVKYLAEDQYVLPQYGDPARTLLAEWNEGDPSQRLVAGLFTRSHLLILDVDWIVVQKIVYEHAMMLESPVA